MTKKNTGTEFDKKLIELEKEVAKRKQAEEAMQESEDSYRILFENLSVGVYRTSGHNGRVIRANPAMASLFGYESIEAFSKIPVSELYMEPEDRNRFLQDIREKGGVKNRELLLKRKDGTPMWASCTATVKYDEKGNIKWIEGIIDDISGRKQAEEAVRRSEEEYRILFENLSVGVYRTSGHNGRVIRANPAMASLFGYESIEAFCKVPVSELYMEPEDRNRFLQDIREKGGVKNRELLLKRKDGTPMWALCTANVMYDEKGDIACIEGIIQDISKRKQAEAMLKQNNEVLNNILSASPVGIGLIVNDAFSWVNEEMLRMFGFKSKADYSGKNARIIYTSEEEYHRVMMAIKERFKAHRSPEVDATFKRKDGLTFTGHFRLSCPDPLNPSKRAIFTIHDISWRMKAEEERVQKEKLHGVLEMAGAVCHEMNQPMQIIINYFQLITEIASENDELSGKTKKIAEQVDRMKKITSKLKNITRYETRDYLRGFKIIDIDKSSTT